MKLLNLCGLFLFTCIFSLVAQPPTPLVVKGQEPIPTATRLKGWVAELCGPAMDGRRGASAGAKLAADMVAREFCLAGLRPAGPEGSFFQVFTLDQKQDKGRIRNVLGLLPGRGPLAQEVVLVCAHYDHLGMGGGESRWQGEPRVHPGANDNASGVATLLGVARGLAPYRDHLGRTVLFAAWGAEELGAHGAKWWAEHQTTNGARVVHVINLDMVGRCAGKLLVAGVASAKGLDRTLPNLAGKLEVVAIGRSFGGSDHQVFLDRGIPAVHLFTGADETYHTPADTPERIMADGLRQVAAFTFRLTAHLSRRPTPYPFVKLGAGKKVSMRPGGKRSVFGSVPDFSQTRGGYRVARVKPDTPAARAGLKGKDLIVEFAGVPIDGFMDFVAVLFTKKPGDLVTVKVRRAGKPMVFKVKLAPR